MDCLLLAGGTPKAGDPLYEECRARPKALLDLGGRPLLQWVVDALGAARAIDRIILVGLGDDPPLKSEKPLVSLVGGGSWSDNFYAGVEWLVGDEEGPGGKGDASRWAAYCAADVPLITGRMVDRFLREASGDDVDVLAGLVPRDALEQRFPEVRETYLRLREGPCVAADLAAFRPSEAARVRPRLEELAPRRKSAWRQAAKVGPGLLLRYALGRLAVSDLVATLERTYALRARIVLTDDAELGLDVDGPGNLAICRSRLVDGYLRRSRSSQ